MAILKQEQTEMLCWESAPLLCDMKMPVICAVGIVTEVTVICGGKH